MDQRDYKVLLFIIIIAIYSTIKLQMYKLAHMKLAGHNYYRTSCVHMWHVRTLLLWVADDGTCFKLILKVGVAI